MIAAEGLPRFHLGRGALWASDTARTWDFSYSSKDRLIKSLPLRLTPALPVACGITYCSSPTKRGEIKKKMTDCQHDW